MRDDGARTSPTPGTDSNVSTDRSTHAVFLRAINGGPANRIRMTDLTSRISALGFADVTTYLATGNVVLHDPDGDSAADVARRLESGLADSGLRRADAMVRSWPYLHALVASEPFGAYPHDGWRRCVSFLRSPPARDGAGLLRGPGLELVHADEHVVLTAFPRDAGAFSLNVETAYRVSATNRWWNVVCDFTDRFGSAPGS